MTPVPLRNHDVADSGPITLADDARIEATVDAWLCVMLGPSNPPQAHTNVIVDHKPEANSQGTTAGTSS
jgi:hypothetical protein